MRQLSYLETTPLLLSDETTRIRFGHTANTLSKAPDGRLSVVLANALGQGKHNLRHLHDNCLMAIPEADLDRILLWCREQWAENMWDKVKCEADVSGHPVDIVEVRRMWDGPGTGDRGPIRESVARFRYTATTGLWSIYWCDSNFRFHEYKYKRPSKNVQPLLDHIANSGDPIFWG